MYVYRPPFSYSILTRNHKLRSASIFGSSAIVYQLSVTENLAMKEYLSRVITRAGLVLRIPKGSKLTNNELDNDLEYIGNTKDILSVVTATNLSSFAPGGFLSHYFLTAQAQNLTIDQPLGGPSPDFSRSWDGHILVIRVTAPGGSWTITWNSIFRAVGTTLPTAINAQTKYMTCVYNFFDAKWDVINVKST